MADLVRENVEMVEDWEISDDGTELICEFETYFDVDEKFNINTARRDDEWLNLYAHYNPFTGTVKLQCVVSNDDEEWDFDYMPTESERDMFARVITGEILAHTGMAPSEYLRKEGSL